MTRIAYGCLAALIVFGGVVDLQADTPPASTAPRTARPNPALAAIEDQPGLPRVLLIGDSISMGYTLPTREKLKGVANVHRVPVNGGPTTRGVDSMEKWLGSGTWDVIHVNFGLHDLKYSDDKGALVDVSAGKPLVSLADYEKNLNQIIERLKRTNATVIYATTTPVPEGAKGRLPADAVKYNEVARQVMSKHKIAINDLYEFVLPQQSELQRPQDVHFTPAGSAVLADEVARVITEALQSRAGK